MDRIVICYQVKRKKFLLKLTRFILFRVRKTCEPTLPFPLPKRSCESFSYLVTSGQKFRQLVKETFQLLVACWCRYAASFFPCFTYLGLFFISLATPDAPAASINGSAASALFRSPRCGIFARVFSILSQPFPVDSLYDCPSVAFNLSSTLQYSLSILETQQVLRGGRRRHDCVNCWS